MIIKRYKNRKLYNMNTSRYVTLDQLIELIRDADSQVEYCVEDEAGQDITRQILKGAMGRIELSNESMVRLIKETF